MDIGDSYFDAQQQQQGSQQQGEVQQQQQQQMQCDPSFSPATFGPPNAPHMPHELPVPSSQFKDQTLAPPTSTDMDIDSLLLQQFSCLGTTDHEDLINQFQSLMNNKMNETSARFFLEMSNWNLQTAVGCYLDVCNFQALPSMKIVQDTRPNNDQQIWRLQNDGTENWPKGCYLMSPSQARRVELPAIKPGGNCLILADIPPTQPAVMWRLCTPNGWYFGEPIWMIPPGTCNSQADLAHRMSQLRTSSNPTIEDDVQIHVVTTVDME